MILPDVNVLLYALRSDSRDHLRYREWLDELIVGPSAYGMSPQVLASVIRVATHPKIHAHPTRLEVALSFTSALREQPHCQIVAPGPRHWGIFSDLCAEVGATGNLVQDAWLAALAIESGCEWVTTDHDFARFPHLRWRRPF